MIVSRGDKQYCMAGISLVWKKYESEISMHSLNIADRVLMNAIFHTFII